MTRWLSLTSQRYQAFWQFYTCFWGLILLAGVVLGFVLEVVSGITSGVVYPVDYPMLTPIQDLLVHVMNWIMIIIGVVGLYGFAWRRKILVRKVWASFFVIEVIYIILFVPFIPIDTLINIGESITDKIFTVVYMLLSIIPLYVAHYLYGFGSPEIWDGETLQSN